MINTFGKTSESRLVTCHPVIQLWARKVLTHHDCSVIYGSRTKPEQKMLFDAGLSQTMDTKHYLQEDGWAHAIDLAPYLHWNNPRIPWDDEKYFYRFIGIGEAVAHDMGLDIINGSDWDNDGDMDDQKFMDLAHWELADETSNRFNSRH